MNVHTALFIIAKKLETVQISSTCEWTDKWPFVHIAKYHSALQRNELLIHGNVDKSQKEYSE